HATGHAGDRAVEVDAEVGPVDLGLRGEADARAAVSVRAEAVDLEVERDRLGDALEGEVALQDEAFLAGLERGGGEGHRRVLLDLEEVGAADVRVALLLAGVDRVEVNRGGDGRGQRVLGGDDGALERVEAATHLADHHVPDGKGNLRVDRVDRPRAGHVAGNLHAHRTSRE